MDCLQVGSSLVTRCRRYHCVPMANDLHIVILKICCRTLLELAAAELHAAGLRPYCANMSWGTKICNHFPFPFKSHSADRAACRRRLSRYLQWLHWRRLCRGALCSRKFFHPLDHPPCRRRYFFSRASALQFASCVFESSMQDPCDGFPIFMTDAICFHNGSLQNFFCWSQGLFDDV